MSTRAQITSEINSRINDNTTQDITPLDVRTVLALLNTNGINIDDDVYTAGKYSQNLLVTRADVQADIASSSLIKNAFYRITDAVGNTREILVQAEIEDTLFPMGVDSYTGEVGTYDITTDVFTVVGGGSGVAGVTGNIVDNTDPANPIITSPYTKDADNNVFYDGVTATLGTGCNKNVFHQDAIINVLGDYCTNNTFEQGANDNELGNDCAANTFKQNVGGFTFGNTLRNVTIEAGASGSNYTASPDYDFLYNNPYPATIFYDGTDNFHKYYDVANDRIVLTNLGTLAVSYIGGAGGGGSTILKGTASGTDTYTTTITGVTSYADGDAYLIRFTNGNTTGSTLNINALGAKTLYRNNDGALIGGDIWADGEMLCIFNSTLDGFQCIGTSPNSLFAYVTNAESVTINKGQPVYAFGAAGNRMSVKLANNTSDATSAKTVGIVYSTSIAANQKGIIIIQGMLEGLSSFPLSTWADGDTVYLGATAGAKTNVKPYAPNHLVYLGIVTTASNGAAGRMYVRVQNGYEMDELHDVAAQNPNNGDLLKYNSSTSLWETAPDLSLAYAYIFG